MDMAVKELARFGQLVDLIYEGATAPDRWTRDILPSVAEYLGAPSCIMYSWLHTPQQGGYFFLHGIEQELVDPYVQKYYDADVWKIAMAAKNLYSTGVIVSGDDIEPRKQLLESVYYKECLSHNRNMVQLLTGIVFGSESATSLPTTCSFFRGSHHPDFTEMDRTRLRLLLPHLSRSLGVMQRLRSTELTLATSLAALDRLPSGVLLLDRLGYVAFANRAASAMLEAGDGLYLRKAAHAAEHKELAGHTLSTSLTIRTAIDATLSVDPYAAQHFSKSIVIPRVARPGSYALQFSALGSHNEFGGEGGAYAAIIFIADGSDPAPINTGALRESYGLTAMEARVAATLVERASAKDVAAALGVSPNTVRTHIKSIYAKLGVDTRTRFVKLMLGISKP